MMRKYHVRFGGRERRVLSEARPSRPNAELGASFLRKITDIDSDPVFQNSASYIQGWLSKLKDDKKLIFKASAEAQKAVDYILGNSN